MQRGCTVRDGLGTRLGRLDDIYADADTREVVFASVAMKRRGRRRSVFVPVTGAVVDGNTITLRCGAQLVRRAPWVHSGRSLPVEDEPALYAHYDMLYVEPRSTSRRLLHSPR